MTENNNNNNDEPMDLGDETLLVYSQPIEVEPPENKEKFLHDTGFSKKK